MTEPNNGATAGTAATPSTGSAASPVNSDSGGTHGAGATPSPAPSFRDSWPDEYKVDPVFKNFNSPEDLLKSYKHTASMVGVDKADIIRKPREGASEADWNQYYEQIGRPKTFGDYQPPKIDGVEFDAKLVNSWREEAHKLGYTQKQFEASLGFIGNLSKQEFELERAERDNMVREGEAKLREKWGSAYEEKVSAVRKAINLFGGVELQKFLDKTGVINNPMIADAFAALGEQSREDVAFGNSITSNAQRALTPTEAALEWNIKQQDKNFTDALFDKNHIGHEDAVNTRARLYTYMYPEKKK